MWNLEKIRDIDIKSVSEGYYIGNCGILQYVTVLMARALRVHVVQHVQVAPE